MSLGMGGNKHLKTLASLTMFLASSSSTLADTLVGPALELAPDCLGGDGLDEDDLRDLDFDLDLRLSRDLERRRWDFFLDSLLRHTL